MTGHTFEIHKIFFVFTPFFWHKLCPEELPDQGNEEQKQLTDFTTCFTANILQ